MILLLPLLRQAEARMHAHCSSCVGTPARRLSSEAAVFVAFLFTCCSPLVHDQSRCALVCFSCRRNACAGLSPRLCLSLCVWSPVNARMHRHVLCTRTHSHDSKRKMMVMYITNHWSDTPPSASLPSLRAFIHTWHDSCHSVYQMTRVQLLLALCSLCLVFFFSPSPC